MERSKITVNIQEGGFENLQKMEAGVFRVAQMLRDRIEAAASGETIKVKVIIVTCEYHGHVRTSPFIKLIYEVVISFWDVEKKFRQSFSSDAYPKNERDTRLGNFDVQLKVLLNTLITQLIWESSARTRQGTEILLCANHMKDYAEAQSAVSE